jgi:hypothetical protein
MRTAMYGDDYAKADLLLGRALARVMAHEFIHILRNSKNHDRVGIEKPAFSGTDLIGPDLTHK